MQKENSVENQQEQDVQLEQESAQVAEQEVSASEASEAQDEVLEALKAELAEAKDKYLRLYSEFDNFRRRTNKERNELIGTATQSLMKDLVPVLDDFDRGLKAMEDSPVKEGIELIANKFKKVLESNGLKKMEVNKGDDFNEDFHEAITQIPAGDDLAGKVVDVVESGYFLSEKVVRFAKVVTGAKA